MFTHSWLTLTIVCIIETCYCLTCWCQDGIDEFPVHHDFGLLILFIQMAPQLLSHTVLGIPISPVYLILWILDFFSIFIIIGMYCDIMIIIMAILIIVLQRKTIHQVVLVIESLVTKSLWSVCIKDLWVWQGKQT